MESYFSPTLVSSIDGLAQRFETKRSAILPILHEIQRENGWISERDVVALEQEFGFSAIDVQEVLTFYTLYNKSPQKPLRFDLCNSVSCWLSGSEETLKELHNYMDNWKKEKGEEPPFEVNEVECLGLCGHAPVALLNNNRHFKVTPELALELVKKYISNNSKEAIK